MLLQTLVSFFLRSYIQLSHIQPLISLEYIIQFKLSTTIIQLYTWKLSFN